MTVLFVGPVPPPVNGFALMNKAMFNQLSSSGATVLFNRAPEADAGGRFGKLRRVLKTIIQLVEFGKQLNTAPQKSVYIGLSGGWGQSFDAAFCMLCWWFKPRLFFHHHSFAYINKRKYLTAFIFTMNKQAQHILLCKCMGEQLVERYGVQQASIHELSNAALMPNIVPENAFAAPEVAQGRVTLGFLSNITAEKGIFDFFEALRVLDREGIKYSAIVAGPVDTGISSEFESTLASAANVRHIGAVYGVKKEEFLHQIDILLFPTRYVNEAEPVTLLEAMLHGAMVVASERGCISGMVPAVAGEVVSIDNFSDAVRRLSVDVGSATPTNRTLRRTAIAELARNHASAERAKLMRLLFLIAAKK